MLLKQPQYQPMEVTDQVMSIFAGSKGFFDQVPTARVAEAEKNMQQFMAEQKSEVRNALEEKQAMDDEMAQQLTDALKEWWNQVKKLFVTEDEDSPVAAAK